jgi:CBS domain-containing protein
MVGLIPKNYILTLLEHRAFYRADGLVEEVDEVYNIQDMNRSTDLHNRTSSIGYKKTETFAMKKKKTFTEFSNQEDAEKFPETPHQLILPWRHFGRDFWSKDKKVTREVKSVCEYYENYMVDLRPYLIESPVTVFTTDSLKNCVELMRNMYLRHLIVISPVDGSLQGIITRQDLFLWLDL